MFLGFVGNSPHGETTMCYRQYVLLATHTATTVPFPWYGSLQGGIRPIEALEKRHYSYECKASTQERPYVSRPSRSQQLRNPKLVPKLTNDTLNPLEKKKGVADEELAKAENERAHQSPHTQSLPFQRALPGPRHPARAEHNPPFMGNEAEALFLTAHEVVVKMTAEVEVAALAQIGAEAFVFKHDAEDLSRDPLPSNENETGGQPKGHPSDFRNPDGPQRQRHDDMRSPEPRGRRDERPDQSNVRHDRGRLSPQGRLISNARGGGRGDPQEQTRDRSLSPFSQRLAMTKAMKQGGR
ncbi:hypothetical protein FHETE_3394 [Fusarium heterosporum]|uniref:Uncharacterized protein n=1 Tax=Fusarium heterosporum TaxID=42747 RepID=A0A8H5TJB9_FUSHE|nr:hypothetical protein FHETE_3394 [Fusarium heterosporum]